METKKKVTHAPTPGPWRYEEVTKTIRSVPSNYWLATMDSWDGAINNEANARLIAAAPELLEAAKRMLEIFKEFPATPEIQKISPMLSVAILRTPWKTPLPK